MRKGFTLKPQLTSNSQQPCLSLTCDLVCTCKGEHQCGESCLSSQSLGGPGRQNCTLPKGPHPASQVRPCGSAWWSHFRLACLAHNGKRALPSVVGTLISLFPPKTRDARPWTSIEQPCLFMENLLCAGQGKMATNSLAQDIHWSSRAQNKPIKNGGWSPDAKGEL